MIADDQPPTLLPTSRFQKVNFTTSLEEIPLFVDDDVAFFTWKTDAVACGSDTFVLRGGQIVVQTVAMPVA